MENNIEEEVRVLPKINLLVVTAILLACKLVGIFPWGWIWVFSPIWFPIAVVIVVGLGCLFLYVLFLML